ncbi:hypothetical protein Syun_016911 [Stephania yunnanensis]|uniref:Uncharacterized protein n=1 Tax=Stephania yunnanensis TaxID=152371 RepID=A0AAP0J5Z4_9MAGN
MPSQHILHPSRHDISLVNPCNAFHLHHFKNVSTKEAIGFKFSTIAIKTIEYGFVLVIGLEPREQRILFRGKKRDDGDYLHMEGVGDMDKVLSLEDPTIKERKLHAFASDQALGNARRTISV